MLNPLIMLARPLNNADEDDDQFQYVRITLGYDRARWMMAAIKQFRDLERSGWLEITQMTLKDPRVVELVTDDDFSAARHVWKPMRDSIANWCGGYLVRTDFPFPPSSRAFPVYARLCVDHSRVYWSMSFDSVDYITDDVFAGDIQRALCILAPDDEVLTHFRQLMAIDVATAVECLKRGGFYLDDPRDPIVRPLPRYSPQDLAPLLSHQQHWVREAAIAALGHIQIDSRSRNLSR